MLKNSSKNNNRKNIFLFLLGIISFFYLLLIINFYFSSKKILEIKLFSTNPIFKQDYLVISLNSAFEKFLSENDLHRLNIEKINIRPNTTTLLIQTKVKDIKRNDEIIIEFIKAFEPSILEAYIKVAENEFKQLRYIINSDLFSTFDPMIKKSHYTNFLNNENLVELLKTNQNLELRYRKIVETDDYLYLHFLILYFICVAILGLFYFKRHIQKIL